jgi:preprotein translocase subunit SecY
MVVVMVAVVFVERAQRRIPVHYAKRQQGRKMFGGQTTHLPLRLNTAGVIPPIFAGSLLVFPATIAQFSTHPWLQEASRWFSHDGILYNVLYVALIIFFSYFYTAIIFDPKDIAENLKKQGGFVPGIRPGDKTKEYIDSVLTRITLWGALYITLVCLLPQVLITSFKLPFYFGGTSVLIVVGVAMDFMSQVNSYMISRQYEGLMGKNKMKGRYQ